MRLMSEPRDHHFIPAFYLKQWAGPSGKLIEFTRKGGKLIAKPIGPRSTGFERDLYAFPELPPEAAQFMEKEFFAYADQKASEALDIHLGRSPSPWTNELISAWSRFIVAIHLRHPDAMPELRQAAARIWQGSGLKFQSEYEAIRKPTDPTTFDEYLALRDPLAAVKMSVNLIISGFDNVIVCAHINKMSYAVVDISASPYRLLTSDRPVQFVDLRKTNGMVAIPISPVKLFVAANEEAMLKRLRLVPPHKVVSEVNAYLVGRARRFVWAQDALQERFVLNRMSTMLEPKPLFPNIDPYEQEASPGSLVELGTAQPKLVRR
jgi:hypothetical protein